MLRRLADDSADVVAVTLGLSSLRLVPPAALFDALAAIVSRASGVGSNLSVDDIKALRGNARKVGTLCIVSHCCACHCSTDIHLQFCSLGC